MGNSKLQLILASASPRRKELVGHLKVPFEIKTLNVEENSDHSDPQKFSQEIAHLKGEAVFNKLILENPSRNYFVVSADTIVCLDGKIYGKPKDRREAEKFLSELSGKTHSVFTAVAVKMKKDGHHSGFEFVEESKVTFNKITPALMNRYLDTGDSLDKAGAYGIQGPSLTFISNVNGCYANVVGFPLSRFVLETGKFLKEESWFDLF